MQFCTSCNIEYEEDKKYCKYCGDPLIPKNESLSTPKRLNTQGESGTNEKVYCPHCKLIYEFGSTCIQCGSPLIRQSLASIKEKLQPGYSPPSEEKSLHKKSSQPQIETSSHKVTCPACNLTYENGNFCIRCGSALIEQISNQVEKESDSVSSPVGENSPQLQTAQKQLIQIPRKNLICPQCRIIYERGESCVRCGSPLVSQTSLMEEKSGSTESPETQPLILQPEGELSSEASLTPPSFVEERESSLIDQIKRKETETVQAPEVEKRKEPLQAKTSDQKSLKKSTEEFERALVSPKKRKRDYRRLFLEVSSVAMIVIAGGYFIWSIYTYMTNKSEPLPTVSKEEAVSPQISSSSIQSSAPITGSEETQNSGIGEDSANRKGQIQDPSVSSIEAQEIENIKVLLENIRKANLQKDINLFLSCYATDFKNREEKKKATLTSWKNFNYLDLSYELIDPSISLDSAKARVEWLIKISPKNRGPSQEIKTLLDVILKKEEGSWKIKEVKQVR